MHHKVCIGIITEWCQAFRALSEAQSRQAATPSSLLASSTGA
jgi:hypothetical protein